MKYRAMAWALLLLATSAAAQQLEPERKIERKFAPGGSIRITLSPGDYTISGTTADTIRVTCHPSRTESGPVEVELQAAGSAATLSVRHTPHHDFHADIEVPQRSNLSIHLAVGDLNVRGVSGSKDVDNRVGDVNIDVRRPEDYRQVDASVGVGDISAAPFNISKGGFIRSFRRHGPGTYRLHVHVGVGDVRLYQTD